jgi:hypothetical protein
MVFGALGVGGAVVALYIRGTIAETIITKLDGRYVGGSICTERHLSLSDHLERMEIQTEKLDRKVETGFNSIRLQLERVQLSEIRVEKDQIRREKDVRTRLENTEFEVG